MASDRNNTIFEKTSFLQGSNSSFIKELYSKYLNNPKSIPQSWIDFFDKLNEDHKILQGIVTFGNTDTKQVMKPRMDIFALEETTLYEVIMPDIIANGYSRIPVFKDNIDTYDCVFIDGLHYYAQVIKDIKNSISDLNKMKDGLNPTKALNQELNDEMKAEIEK